MGEIFGLLSASVLAAVFLQLSFAQGYGAYPYPVSNYGNAYAYASVAAVAIVIAAAALMFAWRSLAARLALAGVALILLGIVAWLYGDYAGGLMQYVWGGIALIILGIIVWLAGDLRAGAFGYARPTVFIGAGAVLELAGTGLWLYKDFGVGVGLMLVGIAVWLYGDYTAGMFSAEKKKR